MSHVDCPHCGARNVRRFASAGLKRCRDCGRLLPTDELDQVSELAADAHRQLGRSPGAWTPSSRFGRES